MTKKQAYKIIQETFGDYDGTTYIPALCEYAPLELRREWCNYWENINTQNDILVNSAFINIKCIKKDILYCSLTRLILLHAFIEDTYD